MRKSALSAFAPLAAAVVIAGCGASASSTTAAAAAAGSGGGPATATSPSAATATTVKLAASKFGKILVDGHGRTLYYFAADHKPGDTTGQDINQFGALWYVLTRNGAEVTHG
jgi:hypothetical protein